MKKENRRNLYSALFMFTAFVLWTLSVCFIDVAAVGPCGSSVGLSAINKAIHNFTGVNMLLYHITDWLGLVPIFVAFGFAVFGLIEWIKRKSLTKVDYNIFVLGGFYIATIAIYFLFESVVINYRPTLIEGFLEASYPSSTTMLVLCVMPTAIMQFNLLIKKKCFRVFVIFIIKAFIVFMVLGRFISGVHWFSDIVGGILISSGLVKSYRFFSGLK